MNAISCIAHNILLCLVLVACADRRGEIGVEQGDPNGRAGDATVPVDRGLPSVSSQDRAAAGKTGSVQLSPVPEPGPLFLFGSALLAAGLLRRRLRAPQPTPDDARARVPAS